MHDILHAIAAPRRREILAILGDDERSAGEIHRTLGDVTFGAVSQHLKVLCDAGLLSRRKQGRERRYRCRPEALAPLVAWLDAMWGRALGDLKALAESEARGDSA